MFLINLVLAKVRSDEGIALATASSGIAATLLDGGTTAHSRFKIPIDIQTDSTCNIPTQSHLARLLCETQLEGILSDNTSRGLANIIYAGISQQNLRRRLIKGTPYRHSPTQMHLCPPLSTWQNVLFSRQGMT